LLWIFSSGEAKSRSNINAISRVFNEVGLQCDAVRFVKLFAKWSTGNLPAASWDKGKVKQKQHKQVCKA